MAKLVPASEEEAARLIQATVRTNKACPCSQGKIAKADCGCNAIPDRALLPAMTNSRRSPRIQVLPDVHPVQTPDVQSPHQATSSEPEPTDSPSQPLLPTSEDDPEATPIQSQPYTPQHAPRVSSSRARRTTTTARAQHCPPPLPPIEETCDDEPCYDPLPGDCCGSSSSSDSSCSGDRRRRRRRHKSRRHKKPKCGDVGPVVEVGGGGGSFGFLSHGVVVAVVVGLLVALAVVFMLYCMKREQANACLQLAAVAAATRGGGSTQPSLGKTPVLPPPAVAAPPIPPQHVQVTQVVDPVIGGGNGVGTETYFEQIQQPHPTTLFEPCTAGTADTFTMFDPYVYHQPEFIAPLPGMGMQFVSAI